MKSEGKSKTLKVEITEEEEDGRTIIKTLEGEDAEKWSQWVGQVCVFAWTHRQNPDWGQLNWEKRELKD